MSAHPPTQPTGPVTPPPALGDDPALRMLLPVGRTVLSIIAGYLGLFAVLLVPAPLALIVGIAAIVDIARHPGKRGLGRAIFGAVMGLAFSAALLFVLLGGM